jgi:hypothetical protein
MCAEYKWLNMENCAMSNFVIWQCIYRWMQRKKMSLRRVTHKAQNLQHHVEYMKDWVRYVLGQMKMLHIPYKIATNFDRTNLDFSVDTGQTLNLEGAKTVAVRKWVKGQSLDRATAYFIAVSMTGGVLYSIYHLQGNGQNNQMSMA